jgi:hypothetical protein
MVVGACGLASHDQRVDAVLGDQMLLDRSWRVEEHRLLPGGGPQDIRWFLGWRIGGGGMSGQPRPLAPAVALVDLACSWRQLPLQVLGSNDVGVAHVQGERLLALPAAQASGHRLGLLLIRARRIPHRLLLDSISTLTPVGAGDLPARRCPRTRWSLLTTAHRACRASYWRSSVPGVVTGAGRPIPIRNPCSAGAVRGSFRRPIGSATTLDRLGDGQRAFNRCKAGLRALVEQAIGIWLLPGRCAAGAGCCSGSGVSAGPPARWSASTGSCTGST